MSLVDYELIASLVEYAVNHMSLVEYAVNHMSLVECAVNGVSC